jgi:hypothetical protein
MVKHKSPPATIAHQPTKPVMPTTAISVTPPQGLFQSKKRENPLVLFVSAIAALALLSAVLAIALLREVRLRRALQVLLFRLMTAWRKKRDHRSSQTAEDSRPADNPDSGL